MAGGQAGDTGGGSGSGNQSAAFTPPRSSGGAGGRKPVAGAPPRFNPTEDASSKAKSKRGGETAVIDPHNKTEMIGLEMNSTGIRNLSMGLFNFIFLTELRMANNLLKSIPSSIGQLVNLVHLDLSNNQIEELPKEIGWLTDLKDLFLYNNQLQDLPPEMGYLYQIDNLGLDGNPISNEAILSVLHSQGPASVIQFLRDHIISLMPPNERIWHSIETASNGYTFTVISYNILSEKYATPQLFGYVPSWFINWEYRKQLIVHEILSYDPDIICLQEMEANQFDQFFKPQFRMRGNYDGVFSPKSRARTMSEWDRTFVDGCAIFYKADKFKLEEKHLVEFNQLALARPSLRKHKDMYNRVMTRDNISLIARLEHRESRQEVIVGNVHVHWDPSFCDVKLVQSILLLEELEKITGKHSKAGLILCGDFNSLPDSGVYNLLEHGAIPAGHEDFMNFTYEPYSNEGAHHGLNLKNAYSVSPEVLDLTIMTPKFRGVIDYIWYRPSNLSVSGLLGPVHQEYTKQLVGFPSQHLPSDHISLLVEFKLEPNSVGAQGAQRREPTAFQEAASAGASTKRLYSRNKHQS